MVIGTDTFSYVPVTDLILRACKSFYVLSLKWPPPSTRWRTGSLAKRNVLKINCWVRGWHENVIFSAHYLGCVWEQNQKNSLVWNSIPVRYTWGKDQETAASSRLPFPGFGETSFERCSWVMHTTAIFMDTTKRQYGCRTQITQTNYAKGLCS